MEQKYFSVDEIATIIDLHPKTVRRFIREGKIKAQKMGREWRVRENDFREYAHGELKTPEAAEKTEPVYAAPGDPERISVSAVVEIREKESEEATRISNSLMALLNSKDPSWGKARYDFIYHPETGTARYVLYGTPKFIAAIMSTFSIIAEQE